VPLAGLGDLLAEVLPPGPVYLHLDVDVVDPGELPGLLFPTPDGTGLADVTTAVRAVVRACDVVAVGFACTWHPDAGGDRVVAPLAREPAAG
jgi:arginase